MGLLSSMATSLPFPSLSSQIQENFVELSTLSLLLTRNLGSDAGESFISCMSLIKADFRYRRPGFLRAMLAWEYEIIPSSEGILIGQLSRVFHELQ